MKQVANKNGNGIAAAETATEPGIRIVPVKKVAAGVLRSGEDNSIKGGNYGRTQVSRVRRKWY